MATTMLTKNSCIASTTIAISASLTISGIAQAKDIESYEDYRLYCSSAAYQYDVQSPDCDKFKSIFEERYRQEQNFQPTRRDTQERQKSSDDGVKGYVGATAGLFFPDTDVLNTGLGVSLYGGARFNKYVAADIEIDLLGGGTTESGVAYGVFAAFINPRFIFPLTDKENSASVYFSPGIGISSLGIGLNFEF
jgi:hypothetical protein